MSDGLHLRPEAQDFLDRAHPDTLKALAAMRPEELAKLGEMADILQSAKAISRFGKWAVASVLAVFVAATQFGESITKLLSLFKGGH